MRQTLNKIILACLALWLPSGALASSVFDDEFKLNRLNYCKPTEVGHNDYEPKQFGKTNNLLRATGEYPVYDGTKIVVYGQVVDSTCAPVSDCTVYLWQVGPDGKYPYLPMRNRFDEKLISIDENLTFIGSGLAKTNNNGKFYFITLRPKSLPKLGCHVNVRIKHDKLGTQEATLFLRRARVKDPLSHPELRPIQKLLQSEDTPFYKFKITMPAVGNDSY